jgi:hypothetical protein
MVWSGHVSALDPRVALIKAWVFFVPESQDPVESGPDPIQRGLGPVPGVRFVPAEVLDPAWRSSPYMQGSDTFPWGSGPIVDTLGCIIIPGHVVAPEPSTWWGRVLFTTRLEIAAWTLRLHTVVRGTPVSGYRKWPPAPPQGWIRACRWGQSLIGDWRCFRALADVITASPPSVTPTAPPVPAADRPVASALDGFAGPRAGCLDTAALVLKIHLLCLLWRPRGGAALARAVVRLLRTQELAPMEYDLRAWAPVPETGPFVSCGGDEEAHYHGRRFAFRARAAVRLLRTQEPRPKEYVSLARAPVSATGLWVSVEVKRRTTAGGGLLLSRRFAFFALGDRSPRSMTHGPEPPCQRLVRCFWRR